MKRGMSTFIVVLIAALVATAILLAVAKIIIDKINSPDELSAEGFSCRAWIVASAKVNTATSGLISADTGCHVIEKTLPLRTSYSGVRKESLDKDQFRDALKKDFAELIAKAWWISAEGEKDDGMWVYVKDKVIGSGKQCMLVYAARVDAPHDYQGFQTITQDDLRGALNEVSKAEAFRTKTPADQQTSIQEYLMSSGKENVVVLADRSKESGPLDKEGVIKIKHDEGDDPIYGIGVGYETRSVLRKVVSYLPYVDDGESVADGSISFIIVAPYEIIGDYCAVK